MDFFIPKSLIVSITFILFVLFNSSLATAAPVAERCVSLFLENEGSKLQTSSRSSEGSLSTSFLTSSLISRLLATANDPRSNNSDAELATKVLRLAEGSYTRYGNRLDQLPNGHPNTKLIRRLLKFYADELMPRLEAFEKNRKDLESVLNRETAEIIEMFADEQAKLVDEIQKIISTSSIRHNLYAVTGRVGSKAIVEIHGYPEIVSELTAMYTGYSLKKGWNAEVVNSEPTSITLEIMGDHALTYLALESGKHRMRRIARGAVHTQDATVHIFKPVDESSIDPETIRREIVFTSTLASGAGGQNVQKNKTAVHATHSPSGEHAKVQEERSLEANKKRAVSIIYGKLKDKADEKVRAEQQAARIRSVDRRAAQRSPFVRTYHLENNSQVAQKILEGHIDLVVESQLFTAQLDQIDILIKLLETGNFLK